MCYFAFEVKNNKNDPQETFLGPSVIMFPSGLYIFL